MLSVELCGFNNSLRMRIRIGALVLCLTVYTAKSLFVGGKSGETFDDDVQQLQRLSDELNETIETEIKVNLLSSSTAAPPSIASFFNFKTLNLLKLPKRNFNVDSAEDDLDNEIESSDVIEIEVPVIGSEYVRVRQDHPKQDNFEVNEVVDDSKGFVEVDFFTVQPTPDIYPSQTPAVDNILTFSTDFQTSPNDETTHPSDNEATTQTIIETTSSPLAVDDEHEEKRELNEDNYIESFQTIESKLMEQWKSAYGMTDDGSFESKLFTLASDEARRPKFPFNVKVVVNNEDEKRSCKSKTSCSQVSFSRRKNPDIDPQFYVDYSDEDLGFKSEADRYFALPNELKARNARRADDRGILTPAPRFPLINQMKKPAFIERLENESSLERSERVNKNLDNMARFISVWAQVDKFVSDRARSAIKKLAHLSGDIDYDEIGLGSRKRIETRTAHDDPFT